MTASSTTTGDKPAGDGIVDPILASETAHLASSRLALAAMREDTLALRAQGGNEVSTEILTSMLQARAESLRDDPRVPLFFGRIDYADDPELDDPGFAGEHFYIGRRHIHDHHGEPMVVDWRAPVSLPFYRANRGDPRGLWLRRRFGFHTGQLTAYEDELLGAQAATAVTAPEPSPVIESRIVTEEIERPRTGPMRDIVSTIQPEQDEIVRGDLSLTVCVQGAPGTGKTAVGLHRVAYLLYTHRERLRRGGTLVVGPNREFLRYIQEVLPALGEVHVAQATLEELVARVSVRAEDSPSAAAIKGDPRMAEVLRRALWSRLKSPIHVMPDGLVVPRGSRRWRVSSSVLTELLDGLRERDVRYGAGRMMLAQRISHAVLVQMERAGEAPDDRVQDAVARTRPVRAAVDALWPAVDPARLVFDLLSDPELLAAASEGVLDEHEQATICWRGQSGDRTARRVPRTVGATRWTLAEAVLVDEAADLIERTPSLAHVVLDEAQDLSAMQCRAVGRRCSTGSLTVLGDIAQGTTPWATDGWTHTLTHLGKPEAVIRELTQGFRVPRQIIDFAARLLPMAAPGLEPPTSVRQADGALEILPGADDAAMLAEVVSQAAAALREEGSVGLIAADARVQTLHEALTTAGVPHHVLGQEPSDGETPDPVAPDDPPDDRSRLAVVPATLAKGLEYDQVLVVEPDEIVTAEPRGLRRLYVVLTRAVSRLVVMHARELPEPLR